MVSNVIPPPAAAPPDPAPDFLGWASLDGLEPWAQVLPQLQLLPAITTPVDPEHPAAVPKIWVVLASWRAAERELATTTLDSPDWTRIHADLVGLRAAHHRLFQERLNPTSQVLRVAGTTLIVWR